MELDRIRHLPPEEVVTCEQCGRILVRVVVGRGGEPEVGP
jgi:predicted  nucleic acid-binding Zn-ribbon protein